MTTVELLILSTIERFMTRQRNRNAFSWLMIAAMLHLMLLASGGVVLASPQEKGEPLSMHAMGQSETPCNTENPTVSHDRSVGCDSCQDSGCQYDCASCAQAHFLSPDHHLSQTSGSDAFSASPPLKLILHSTTPNPRPPQQLDS